MATDRRNFLRQASSLALVNFLPKIVLANTVNANNEHIIGASRLDDSHYAISSITLEGRLNWQSPIPARGHDVCCHATKPVGVAIARRPSRFILLFNASTGDWLDELTVDANLKLNGHACWIGDKLIVSASDRESSQMCLLTYQFNGNNLTLSATRYYDYIGPHELMYVNSDLWVAVGGLMTKDRVVTNKSTLASFLLRIDVDQLTVKNDYEAPFASLSLRHLAASDQGQLFVAGQYQLDPTESPPLLYTLHENRLVPFKTDARLWSQLKGYIGSIVCINNTLVASCPRSHWLGWFDLNTLSLKKNYLTADVCALASTHAGVIAGTGTGRLYYQGQLMTSKVKWDNHFTHYLNKA